VNAGQRLAGLLFLAFAPPLTAIEMALQPESPTFQDVLRIELRGCTQGGVLHWGVNARGNQWQKADFAYRPTNSAEDGVATRTPLEGPDAAGVCRATLGPFDHTNQLVGSVDFAVQWRDGSWNTADGKDFHIPISSARILVTPPHPTLNDVVVVTVRRSAPGGRLRWGVNQEFGQWSRPNSAYWPSGTGPSDDGLAADSPIPPPDAKGESVITLGPFNRPEQPIESVHMAVHWGPTWDTDFGRNYNVPVSLVADLDAPSVIFTSPTEGQNLRGDRVVSVALANADTLTLWLDGAPLVTLLGPPFTFTLESERVGYGRHTLVAHAVRDGRAGLGRVEFWRVPAYREAELPSGTRPGATAGADGNYTFSLFAPGKHFVSLVGDFNGWNPESDPMNQAPDGTWWIQKDLAPGRHRVQYCVEGRQFLCDPYARDVEWKDEQGRETHRPEQARGVIQAGALPFAWSDESFRRPPLEDLLIYEFDIDDFCPGEGFTGVIARLDYIRDLGVNAIEPMPFMEFPGAWSWGYNPAFHFAPESTYGTPDELKRLVDEAHRRGLAVIVDMVLNHMDWNSPLFQLYGLDYNASPYFHLFLGENWGFPDLDQTSPAFKRYAADVLRCWIEEYHADGFRYDATRWVGWGGYNDWGASWFAYAAKQADSRTYQIAEHLPADPELQSRTEMDTGWHDFFRWRLRDMILNATLDRGDFERLMDPRRMGFSDSFERVAYVESHDEERFLRDLEQAGYAPDEAIRRDLLALAITLTAPGVAMVYAGEEFGEATPKAVAPNPLHWDRLNRPECADLHAKFKALARLRTTHPALNHPDITWVVDGLPEGAAVYERAVPGASVVVVANFGRVEQVVPVELPPGTWTDVLAAGLHEISGGTNLDVRLAAGGVRVLAVRGR
jgi:1,4-alpha-glucan branching enzyme